MLNSIPSMNIVLNEVFIISYTLNVLGRPHYLYTYIAWNNSLIKVINICAKMQKNIYA